MELNMHCNSIASHGNHTSYGTSGHRASARLSATNSVKLRHIRQDFMNANGGSQVTHNPIKHAGNDPTEFVACKNSMALGIWHAQNDKNDKYSSVMMSGFDLLHLHVSCIGERTMLMASGITCTSKDAIAIL